MLVVVVAVVVVSVVVVAVVVVVVWVVVVYMEEGGPRAEGRAVSQRPRVFPHRRRRWAGAHAPGQDPNFWVVG